MSLPARPFAHLASVCVLLGSLACAEGGELGPDAGIYGGSGTAGGGGSSDPGAEQGGDGDDSQGEDPDPDPDPDEADETTVAARGIHIREVEANQGTAIPIGADGVFIDGPERLARLVKGRDTLIRVHYELLPGWTAKPVTARLILDFPDGSSRVLEDTREISGSSNPNHLDGTFFFGLVGENDVVPGVSYRVELRVDAQLDQAELTAAAWATPLEGSAPIGIEQADMKLKLVFVPVGYEGRMPDMNEAAMDKILDSIHEHNPVTDIEVSVREPVYWNYAITEHLGGLVAGLSQLHADDGAGSNVYYHGLVDIGCSVVGCGAAGIAGTAYVLDGAPSPGDAHLRVGASVYYYPEQGESTVRSVTHELGHNQGLGHVACPGVNAGPVDESYPYANGVIGNHGFGVRSFEVHAPHSAQDYMSYCPPTFVSPWSWTKTFERIQTLTSWDGASMGAEPETAEGMVLAGSLMPHGEELWWTMPGRVDAARVGSTRVELGLRWGGVQLVEAASYEISEGGRLVVASLPVGLDELSSVTRVDGGQRHGVELAKIHAQGWLSR